MATEISVTHTDSHDVGGCNACTYYVTAQGGVKHRVTLIQVRGASFRVCDYCRAILLQKLQESTPEQKRGKR